MASRDFKLGGRWEENVGERGRNLSGENETDEGGEKGEMGEGENPERNGVREKASVAPG